VNAVVELHYSVIWPKLLFDFFARDQTARTLHQHQQNLEGLFLKTNLPTSGMKFTRLHIELKGPDPYPV
jgi:hypothetical protein